MRYWHDKIDEGNTFVDMASNTKKVAYSLP